MKQYVTKYDVLLALVEKGQASKRYKLGESWELNLSEIKDALDNMPPENIQSPDANYKFYYCKSEDDYYIGQRVDNFYYAKYNPVLNDFVWCMSKHLPWGEHVVDKDTLWKEYKYPSEPVEISFLDWIRGFTKKYYKRAR